MAMNPHNPILYQNTDHTIVIIDIPTSISQAQDPLPDSCNIALFSSDPVQEPYLSTEPQTHKSRENLVKNFLHEYDNELDSVYTKLIRSAMAELQQKKIEAWYLPRKFSRQIASRKRKASLMSVKDAAKLGLDTNDKPFEIPKREGLEDNEIQISNNFDHIVSEKAPSLDICINNSEILHSWDGSFYNHDDKPAQMTIQRSNFTIPVGSTFVLGDCTKPAEFRNTFRSISSEYELKRHFDFILLDPPWPNSSVKRKGAYSIARMLRETKSMLLGMDLDQYVASDGLLGMWITNKPAIRELVLGSGGIFEAINVGLIEEWVWVKTTARGEPVTATDGLWRKPYEILLLGRAPNSRLEAAQHSDNVKRRVMFGVPDLHSRKPCLRVLIEPLLPEGYLALEVFARHLVAGWWSWGNEVLKFNWDGYWHRGDEDRMSEASDAKVVRKEKG
jgi:N6-adenosine-specific RNA methylase IME4